MKTIIGMLTASFLGVVSVASAFADPSAAIRNSQRIVVVTDSEGIHYAHGCAFYEMRDLLADGTRSTTELVSVNGEAQFEIRILGKTGDTPAQLGDRWIRIDGQAFSLSDATYDRIIALIDARKGAGVGKQRVANSIQAALEQIQDPAYVEQNRCQQR